jgi:ELWxxDGT repeat protein
MPSKIFFAAHDSAGTEGNELWVTDGTAAGTTFVADIRPGASGSNPGNFAALGSSVVFKANDGVHGTELWISDGTAAGTSLVKDIYTGAGSSNPYGLTTIGSEVVFRASDGVSGAEVWATDGTAAGTVLLKDIAPGPAGSYPSNFTPFGSELLFNAKGSDGFGLWETNGTAAGTTEIKTIYPNAIASGAGAITVAGSKAFFAANDGVNGSELWVTDGTSAGTNLVTDINPGSASSSPSDITAIGNKVVFVANDGVHGSELWVSDGTASGTSLLKDIDPGRAGSSIYYVAGDGGHALFFANDGTSPYNQLWSTDGTAAGTVSLGVVKDNGALAVVNGEALFKGNDGVHGDELWVSNGTAAGTHQLKDLLPGPSGSYPYGFTTVGNRVLFTAEDLTFNFGLWTSDGTASNTYELSNAVYSPSNFFNAAVSCFAAGTLIATPLGQVAVEHLSVGDLVDSARGPSPIRWIGRTKVHAVRHPTPQSVNPVRIHAGAFGGGLPTRELSLPPEHAVFANGMLVPVRCLVNGASIVQESVDRITYLHIELDAHGVLFAEGLPVESYRDTGSRAAFDSESVRALHPDLAKIDNSAPCCVPMTEDGPELERLRSDLAGFAAQLGMVAPAAVTVHARAPGSMRVTVPAHADRIHLLSAACVPPGERRRLGVAVTGVSLSGRALPLGSDCFGVGFHEVETEGGSWRWTNGSAVLLLKPSRRNRRIVIEIAAVAASAIAA